MVETWQQGSEQRRKRGKSERRQIPVAAGEYDSSIYIRFHGIWSGVLNASVGLTEQVYACMYVSIREPSKQTIPHPYTVTPRKTPGQAREAQNSSVSIGNGSVMIHTHTTHPDYVHRTGYIRPS